MCTCMCVPSRKALMQWSRCFSWLAPHQAPWLCVQLFARRTRSPSTFSFKQGLTSPRELCGCRAGSRPRSTLCGDVLTDCLRSPVYYCGRKGSAWSDADADTRQLMTALCPWPGTAPPVLSALKPKPMAQPAPQPTTLSPLTPAPARAPVKVNHNPNPKARTTVRP